MFFTFELCKMREPGVAIIESPGVDGPNVLETSNCELDETCNGVSEKHGNFNTSSQMTGETRARFNMRKTSRSFCVKIFHMIFNR